MKKIFCLLTLFIFSCNLQEHFHKKSHNRIVTKEELASDEFVENTSDIPLAKHLTKVSQDDLDFDSLVGSLYSISYKSEIELNKIKKFYKDTLPQLGWKIKKSNSEDKLIFSRDKENLEIDFVREGGQDVVKFFLESAS